MAESKNVSASESGSFISPCHPALNNELIISNMFEYFDVNDFKMYRSVSKRLLKKSENEFLRRSRLALDFSWFDDFQLSKDDRDTFLEQMSLKNLSGVFDSLLFEAPVVSALFKGPLPWSIQEIKDFFTNEGVHIKDLKLERMKLMNEKGKVFLRYNCINLLGENYIHRLKKLTINQFHPRDTKEKTELVIPLHLLRDIQELSLDNCGVLLALGMGKIRPKKLALLSDVEFIFYLPEVLINDFIDFEELEDLKLETSLHPHLPNINEHNFVTSVSLDMRGDFINLKVVELCGVRIVDYENSNWSIRKLILSFIIFNGQPTSTHIHVKEVSLNDLNFRDVFPMIQLLPQSLERLLIAYNCTLQFTQMVRNGDGWLPHVGFNFENLKYLLVPPDFVSSLPRFSLSPNLTDLEIMKFASVNGITHSLNSIPQTIKRLKIHGGNTFQFLPGVIKLELCVLASCNLSFIKVKDLVDCFQPNAFVIEDPIFVDSAHNGGAPEIEILEDPKIIMLLTENSEQKISIGPFYWNKVDFLKSQLFPHVDTEAQYYTFKNTQGKGMTRAEFKKMTTF